MTPHLNAESLGKAAIEAYEIMPGDSRTFKNHREMMPMLEAAITSYLEAEEAAGRRMITLPVSPQTEDDTISQSLEK
jgi:hypothetical protein